MPRQLTLDLRTPPAMGRADFLPAPANAAALAALDQPAQWPQGRLILCGPEGSGKSHIAAFWAAENGARRVAARSLSPEVADIPSSDYPTPARRPLNSRLDCSAIFRDFGIPRPDWREGLDRVIQELSA